MRKTGSSLLRVLVLGGARSRSVDGDLASVLDPDGLLDERCPWRRRCRPAASRSSLHPCGEAGSLRGPATEAFRAPVRQPGSPMPCSHPGAGPGDRASALCRTRFPVPRLPREQRRDFPIRSNPEEIEIGRAVEPGLDPESIALLEGKHAGSVEPQVATIGVIGVADPQVEHATQRLGSGGNAGNSLRWNKDEHGQDGQDSPVPAAFLLFESLSLTPRRIPPIFPRSRTCVEFL